MLIVLRERLTAGHRCLPTTRLSEYTVKRAAGFAQQAGRDGQQVGGRAAAAAVRVGAQRLPDGSCRRHGGSGAPAQERAPC